MVLCQDRRKEGRTLYFATKSKKNKKKPVYISKI